VAPIGVFHRSARLDSLVTGARDASIQTHGGPIALAAAAATAAAVSAAIDGASEAGVFEHAVLAAGEAERRWPGQEGAVFSKAVLHVRDDLASAGTLEPAVVAARCFPRTPLTIVPLALALATLLSSAGEAILLAANLGGDSDSVASIAGGILGARAPHTVSAQWCAVVETVNGHNLDALADALAAVRSRN
jgi:ADP-ribosylglycohydrolase